MHGLVLLIDRTVLSSDIHHCIIKLTVDCRVLRCFDGWSPGRLVD